MPDPSPVSQMPPGVKTYVETPPSARYAVRLAEGAIAPWQGLQYLARHPSLWRYAIPPIVVNMLITGVVLLILLLAATWMIHTVHPWLTEGRAGASRWLAVALEIVIALALVAGAVVLSVVTFKTLSGILVGYAYGLLAEKVERSLGVPADRLQSISYGQELVDTLLGLAVLIAVNIGLNSLNMIPVAGTLIALSTSMIFTLTILGLDVLAYPLTLRGVRRLDHYKFARRHHAHTVGLGAVVFGLQLIPFVGAVFLTTGVVGGVLLHRKLAMPGESSEVRDEP